MINSQQARFFLVLLSPPTSMQYLRRKKKPFSHIGQTFKYRIIVQSPFKTELNSSSITEQFHFIHNGSSTMKVYNEQMGYGRYVDKRHCLMQ